MIKNLFIIILFIILSISTNVSLVSAATPSPTEATTTPTASISTEQSVNEKLNKQINQLKERIASRVAELNLVEKRGVIGTITETTDNKITFTDLNVQTRIIDVDEITKFNSSSAKDSFGISDLTKGTKISVLGLYNKQSRQILARFIDTFVTPVFLSGRIADLDKKNYQVTIINEDQKQTVVDIQTFTVISAHSKEDGISKLGFSKLNIGDRIITTGFPDKKDPALLVASRILVLSGLPNNPKIIIPEPLTDEETITSTTSGIKKIPTPTQ